jgi:predicted nucleic acid-binding protein
MRAFLDTSVLVPVFYGEHVHHEDSLTLFAGLDRDTGCCGGEQALLFVANIRSGFRRSR